ncbi:PREDICTED: histone-lysine N-methyltransferase SETMAR-like [Atta cephalotes]|uniref:Mos1 transposase HTH domain-containing protein n=1 Tax=Atta cephalotes TaxID=12957 RepID=A0A158NSL1_ATTCE|nr:PREDICTED: histone-lysine N-methyltransferase SETMAR-like [Atta cephalotes]
MKALVQANKYSTVREFATALKVSVGSVHGHLKSLGFIKKLDDEKWIVYNNVSRKRSWSRRGETPERQAKAEIHQKKVMLSMWWDWKESVFYELLPKNKTINSDVYCEQLQKLSDAIAQKHSELINRKGVVFHHDNARPHKFGYSAKIVAT